MNVVPLNPEAIDCEWWDSFWHRNFSPSGRRNSTQTDVEDCEMLIFGCELKFLSLDLIRVSQSRLVDVSLPSGEDEAFKYFFRFRRRRLLTSVPLVREDLISDSMTNARAFAQLKGSWRILNKVVWRADRGKLHSIILVCCLLHNIRIDCGDLIRDDDVALYGHHDPGYSEQRVKDKASAREIVSILVHKPWD